MTTTYTLEDIKTYPPTPDYILTFTKEVVDVYNRNGGLHGLHKHFGNVCNEPSSELDDKIEDVFRTTNSEFGCMLLPLILFNKEPRGLPDHKSTDPELGRYSVFFDGNQLEPWKTSFEHFYKHLASLPGVPYIQRYGDFILNLFLYYKEKLQVEPKAFEPPDCCLGIDSILPFLEIIYRYYVHASSSYDISLTPPDDYFDGLYGGQSTVKFSIYTNILTGNFMDKLTTPEAGGRMQADFTPFRFTNVVYNLLVSFRYGCGNTIKETPYFYACLLRPYFHMRKGMHEDNAMLESRRESCESLYDFCKEFVTRKIPYKMGEMKQFAEQYQEPDRMTYLDNCLDLLDTHPMIDMDIFKITDSDLKALKGNRLNKLSEHDRIRITRIRGNIKQLVDYFDRIGYPHVVSIFTKFLKKHMGKLIISELKIPDAINKVLSIFIEFLPEKAREEYNSLVNYCNNLYSSELYPDVKKNLYISCFGDIKLMPFHLYEWLKWFIANIPIKDIHGLFHDEKFRNMLPPHTEMSNCQHFRAVWFTITSMTNEKNPKTLAAIGKFQNMSINQITEEHGYKELVFSGIRQDKYPTDKQSTDGLYKVCSYEIYKDKNRVIKTLADGLFSFEHKHIIEDLICAGLNKQSLFCMYIVEEKYKKIFGYGQGDGIYMFKLNHILGSFSDNDDMSIYLYNCLFQMRINWPDNPYNKDNLYLEYLQPYIMFDLVKNLLPRKLSIDRFNDDYITVWGHMIPRQTQMYPMYGLILLNLDDFNSPMFYEQYTYKFMLLYNKYNANLIHVVCVCLLFYLVINNYFNMKLISKINDDMHDFIYDILFDFILMAQYFIPFIISHVIKEKQIKECFIHLDELNQILERIQVIPEYVTQGATPIPPSKRRLPPPPMQDTYKIIGDSILKGKDELLNTDYLLTEKMQRPLVEFCASAFSKETQGKKSITPEIIRGYFPSIQISSDWLGVVQRKQGGGYKPQKQTRKRKQTKGRKQTKRRNQVYKRKQTKRRKQTRKK